MKLQREDAGRLETVVVVVGDFGDELAVHAQRQLSTLGDEMIFVPFIEPEIIRAWFKGERFRVLGAAGVKHGSLGLQRQVVATELVIEPGLPRHVVVVVHLVACHVAIGQSPAAELKAAINRRRIRAAQTEGQPQLEVIEQSALPHEILIQLGRVFRRDGTGDRSLLNGPKGHVLPEPTFERASVEDWLEPASVSSGVGYEDKGQKAKRGGKECGSFHAASVLLIGDCGEMNIRVTQAPIAGPRNSVSAVAIVLA